MLLIVGYILIMVGVILAMASGIWLIVEAFKTGPLWGVMMLFFSCFIVPVIIWVAQHKEEAMPPILAHLGSILPLTIGIAIIAMESLAVTL